MATMDEKTAAILRGLPSSCKLTTLAESGLVDVEHLTLQDWCRRKVYPHAWRQGKFWYLRPAQFLEWFQCRSGRRAGS
jgi:hypothetical protein